MIYFSAVRVAKIQTKEFIPLKKNKINPWKIIINTMKIITNVPENSPLKEGKVSTYLLS